MNYFMKIAVEIGVIAGVLLSNINTAKALDFTFSFTNEFGTIPGTVVVTLFGLTDNATSSPTAVVVQSAPTPLDVFNGVDFMQAPFSVVLNSFTLSGGLLTGGLGLYEGPMGCGLGVDSCLDLNFDFFLFGLTDGSPDFVGASTFTPLSVPVPYEFESATGLAILGLGYGLCQLRKKSMASQGKSTSSDPVLDLTITETEIEEKELSHV